MIGSQHEADAAMHEAGHAIIGINGGRVPDELCIYNRWLGRCIFLQSTFDYRQVLKESIAGCLAQAKVVAARMHGGLITFDMTAELAVLDHLFQENRADPNWKPGQCTLALVKDGNKVSIELEAEWFGVFDWTNYRNALRESKKLAANGIDTKQVILEVMQELDEPKNWNRVCKLAEVVQQQKPDDLGRLIVDKALLSNA